MKTSELRGKSAEELNGIILSSKKEQFNLRMQIASGEGNASGFRELRRTIARAKTLMGEAANPNLKKLEKKAEAPKKAPAKKAKKG